MIAQNRRAILVQIGVLLALIAGGAWLASVTADNLARRGAVAGFGFLRNEAGFGLGESLPLPEPSRAYLLRFAAMAVTLGVLGGIVQLAWRRRLGAGPVLLALVATPFLLDSMGVPLPLEAFGPQHSLLFALLTGLANTVKVAVPAVALATVVGVAVGLGRLAPNPLVRAWATLYVELFRNVPLLIQVFFWYFGVLRALPPVRGSLHLGTVLFLSNRGLYVLAPTATTGTAPMVITLLLAAGILLALRRHRSARRLAWSAALALVLGCMAVFGSPAGLSLPVLHGFNFTGGAVITPEYAALAIALSIYAGAFIAEIVRGSVAGVPRGQTEAARALGLSPAQTMRLVILPQALRTMGPPLISQYLAQVKDSSLGVAIAYPELISVSNTVINQSGAVIEMVVILVVVYGALNLGIVAVLGRLHARVVMPA